MIHMNNNPFNPSFGKIPSIFLKRDKMCIRDRAVTDGEFRRSWWHLDFLWGLTGVKKYDYHESYKFHGAKTRTDNAELAGKVAYNPEHPFFKAFELSLIHIFC